MNGIPGSLLEQWAQSPGAMRLGSVLLHFVWQGALLGSLAYVFVAALRRSRPQVRYMALLAIFGALATCPVVTFFVVDVNVKQGAAQADPQISRVAPVPSIAAMRAAAAPGIAPQHSSESSGRFPPVADQAAATAAQKSSASAPTRIFWNDRLIKAGELLREHRHWVVAAWLTGVCLFSLRLAGGLIGAERARRRGASVASGLAQQIAGRLANRLGIRRSVQIVETALAEAPALIGWLRPVILLPASAAIGLTPTQLEAILAHELAHVRRHDYLVNLLQTIVETILYYHPAVWWISRRIRQEREHCCDDLAIAICADRVAYARALTAMEELRAAPASWVVAARGGSLVERIRRIVGRPEPAASSRPALAAIAAVLMLVTAVTIHLGPTASAVQPARAAAASAADNPKDPRPSPEKNAAAESGMRRIAGRVIDDHGKPVAAARLCWHVRHTMYERDENVEGISDDSGAFQLAAPLAWKLERPSSRSDILWVLAKGKSLAVVRATTDLDPDAEARDLVIRLEAATDTAFEVFDHTGTPLAGARVEPFHFRAPHRGFDIIPEPIRKLLRKTSDAAGKVPMPQMPRQGFFSVQVTAESFGTQRLQLDPRAAAPAERLLTLRETGRIEGWLIADKPEWTRGVKVQFQTSVDFRQLADNLAHDPEGSASAVTDEQGHFVVPALASGRLMIDVHTADDLPVRPKFPENLQVHAGDTTEIEIPLIDTVLVRGSVRTEDTQAPVPGAEIHVYFGGPRQGGNVVSDHEGRFELRVLPGGLGTQIIVMPKDFGDRYEQVGAPWSERQQVPEDAKEFELDPILLSPLDSIAGKLLDHRGRPVAKTQINGVHQNRRYGFTETDEQGRFSVKFPKRIKLESYEVFRDEGQTSHHPTIEQEDPLVLKLAPPPDSEPEADNGTKNKEPEPKNDEPKGDEPNIDESGKTASDPRRPWSVHGRVTDAKGQPMAGVVVTAHTGMGTLRETGRAETDAQGKYAFDFGPGVLLDKDNTSKSRCRQS